MSAPLRKPNNQDGARILRINPVKWWKTLAYKRVYRSRLEGIKKAHPIPTKLPVQAYDLPDTGWAILPNGKEIFWENANPDWAMRELHFKWDKILDERAAERKDMDAEAAKILRKLDWKDYQDDVARLHNARFRKP